MSAMNDDDIDEFSEVCQNNNSIHNGALSYLMKKVDEIEKELHSFKNGFGIVKSKQLELKDENVELRRENKKLKSKIDDLKTELKDLEKTLNIIKLRN